jgi:hypothetical protein
MPNNYFEGDKWSGYCWLDPKDVFDFLGFNKKTDLSLGAKQVYEWFLDRLHLNCNYSLNHGIMGNNARRYAQKEIEEMCFEYGNMSVDYDDIFNFKYRI